MNGARCILMAVAAAAIACSGQDKPAFPNRPAPEAEMTVEQVNAKIEDLQKQLEDLEQKKAEAERLADLQARLTDLHNESKERVKDVEAQLANMELEEKPVSPAQHAFCDGKKKFLERSRSLSVDILAIKDPGALEQARHIRQQIDALETAWHIVDEPALNTARTLEDLTKNLEENDNQYRRETLEKLRQLAAQDADSRAQELAIVSARREREKLWDKLVEAFYEDH